MIFQFILEVIARILGGRSRFQAGRPFWPLIFPNERRPLTLLLHVCLIGGPGSTHQKTRLAKHVLAPLSFIQHIEAFNHAYSDAGLSPASQAFRILCSSIDRRIFSSHLSQVSWVSPFPSIRTQRPHSTSTKHSTELSSSSAHLRSLLPLFPHPDQLAGLHHLPLVQGPLEIAPEREQQPHRRTFTSQSESSSVPRRSRRSLGV